VMQDVGERCGVPNEDFILECEGVVWFCEERKGEEVCEWKENVYFVSSRN